MHETLEGMEYIGESINGNIFNNLRLADNTDLIARQLSDLQQLLNKVKEVLRLVKQTEWLIMGQEDSINKREQLTLKGKPL